MSENEFSIVKWDSHPEILFADREYTVFDFDMKRKAVYVIDDGEGMWLHASLITLVV